MNGGGVVCLFDKSLYATCSGINKDFLYYHPVTGFGFEEELKIVGTTELINSSVGGRINYAIGSKRWSGDVHLEFKTRHHSIGIRGGEVYSDWKGVDGEPRFQNTVSSLFFKRNYISLFRNRYWNVKWMSRVSPRLAFELCCNSSHIRNVDNCCDFSVFYKHKAWESNVPYNKRLDEFALLSKEQMVVGLKAICALNDFATLIPVVQKGLGVFNEKSSNYSFMDVSLLGEKPLGGGDRFEWLVEVGGFENVEKMSFMQWKHFSGSDRCFVTSDDFRHFMIFKPYETSANDIYSMLSLRYVSHELVLTRSTLVQTLKVSEELGARFLAVRKGDVYTELVYSIDNLLPLGKMGVCMAFVNNDFHSVKYRMSFSLDK